MSGPYGPVTQLPVDKERRINVHFRLPFLTKWGQSLIVTGTGVLVALLAPSPQDLSLIVQYDNDPLRTYH
jgi:hypothetical protein